MRIITPKPTTIFRDDGGAVQVKSLAERRFGDWLEQMRRKGQVLWWEYEKCSFPYDSGLAELRELGVRFVLVLEKRLPEDKREALHRQTGLVFERSFGSISVYRLKPSEGE